MIRVMFVCLGNICRSPMAEFMLKDLVKKDGRENDFLIASAGTSYEEEGAPVHRGARRVLERLNINCDGKYAVRLEKEDLDKYDYFVCMDEKNLYGTRRILGDGVNDKLSLLLEHAGEKRSVSDPYWTGDFETTFRDVKKGVHALYEKLLKEEKNFY